MRKILWLVAVSVLILGFGATTVSAGEVFDFRTKTCGELLKLATEDQQASGMVLLWLDGYLAGVTDDTVFNEDEFTEFAKDLGEYCKDHQELSLLTAAEEVGTE